jgi:EmrB/QacA subfamily drug resistance transporter
MISSVNVALPAIGDDFQMGAVMLSWVNTSYLLAATVFLVPCGRLADLYGRKKFFAAGMFIYTGASLLAALSTTPGMFIVSRVIQGLGGAIILGTGVAILTSVFPAGERGRALGINVSAVYLGLSLGPFIGGFITGSLGWPTIFLVNIPLGVLVVILLLAKLRSEWAGAKGERFDLPGSIIYGATLMALMYGFSRLPSTEGIALVALGAALLLAFMAWESRVKHPVLDISLFQHNTVFAFSSLAALINYSATFGVTFLLSLYLQLVKGLGPEQAGTVLVAQPAVMTIFSPFTGRLSDRLEPLYVASTGMAFTTLGLAMMIFLGQDTTLAYVVVSLLVIGFGFALFSSPNTNAIMSSVEKRFLGVAAGTVGTMRMVGQMLSMGLAMLVFALYLGEAEITLEHCPEFLSSMHTAFIIFTALCFLGIFTSLARGNVRESQKT